MMKIALFLLAIVWASASYSQTNSLVVLKDTNYFYRDTVEKKPYVGSYKPTGLIVSPDNSIIISSELRIEFPGMYDRSQPPMSYPRFLEYDNHTHISSGSVFKVHDKYKKEWEVILKDKRVEQIRAYDDTTFIAAGDNVDMRKAWVARIRKIDGRTVWLKEFAVRHQATVQQLSISGNKDILVLTNNKRLIPLTIRKQYGKIRIAFFKKRDDFEYSLSLSCLSGNGKLTWTKTVGFKRGYDFMNYDMASDTNINLLYRFNGYDKVGSKHIRHEGENGNTYNLKGDRLVTKALINNEQAFSLYDNGWEFVNIKNDSISVEKLDDNMERVFYKLIKTPQKYQRIQAMSRIGNAYYLYGYMDTKTATHLICKFDTTFRLLTSWIYKSVDRNNDIQLSSNGQGHLVIMGMCYRNADQGGLNEYINLVELKLN